MEERARRVFWTLRVVYGLLPIVVGADKFLGLLTDWSMYLGPLPRRLLPVPVEVFMNAVAVGEIALGLAVLSRWVRIAAWLEAAWLLAIAGQIATTGAALDVALRDLVLAFGAGAVAALAPRRSS